jgi:hypothetical protein
MQLSSWMAGRQTDLRRGWSTWIFARLCATSHSMKRLLMPVTSSFGATIDHGSIVCLARNVMEAGVLISYISQEGLSEDEWKCRLQTFHIHDCVARIRLFKGISADRKAEKMRVAIEELRSRISSNAHFKKLPEEAQEKVLAGSVIYLGGLRSAAEVAGWSKSHFDAMYNYFSMQSHSAPMGFYQMDHRKIDYKKITPYQFYLVGLALEIARISMDSSSKRMRELFPDEDVKSSK